MIVIIYVSNSTPFSLYCVEYVFESYIFTQILSFNIGRLLCATNILVCSTGRYIKRAITKLGNSITLFVPICVLV